MRSIAAWSLGLSVVLSAVAGTGVVVADSKKQDNRCDKYHFIGGSYSWFGAYADAETRGGRLATISSVEEATCVYQVTSGSAWLGGSDIEVDQEWRWSASPKNGLFYKGEYDNINRSFGYTNWSGGEPNGGTGENCLQFSSGGSWNDLNCSIGLPYVIRYP